MSVNKRVGYGVTLGCDPAGSTTYATVGAIVDGFKGPTAKAEVADTTLLSDKYATCSKTVIKPGDVTFTIAYDPDETSNAALVTCFKSMSATPPTWLITYPTGTVGAGTHTTETFSAHLIGMTKEVMRDKMVTCEVTLAVTGDPGFYGD